MSAGGAAVGTAYARAALVGHPSDGFGGAVVAARVLDYRADVIATPADAVEVEVVPPNASARMLLVAAERRFASHCRDAGEAPPVGGCRLQWSSTIPREAGLGGSSALVLAALRALATHRRVVLHEDELPALVLAVEVEELGIAAGPQDRVVQVHGGLVYMDFSTAPWRVESLDPDLPGRLFLAHRPGAEQASSVVHGDLRARFARGERDVVGSMAQLAELASDGRRCLLDGDHGGLAEAIDAGFDVRRRLLALDTRDVELVALARSHGAAATFAGSGGAVVGTVPSAGVGDALAHAFAARGWPLIWPRVG